MKVKDFLACIKSLHLDEVCDDVGELQMMLCPSYDGGSPLIWTTYSNGFITFSTREQLLKDGYSNDVIDQIANKDYVHHDIS